MNLIRIYSISVFCGLALLLSSCGSKGEDVMSKSGFTGINFSISSLGTKTAAIMDVDSILSLGVFGYSSSSPFSLDPINRDLVPDLLYNQKAERVPGGEWTYDTIVYWPLDLSVNNTFFAYSPHSSEFSEEANIRVSNPTAFSYPTLTYTIPEVVADQQDILYSEPVYDKNRNSNDLQVSDGTVKYHMKHAMSWLAFVVTPTEYFSPDERYTVTWFAFMADRLPVTSTLNLGTGKWSAPSYGLNIVYDFDLSDAAENIPPGETARIVDPNNVLMLLPFDIDSGESNATIDLIFTYDTGGGSNTTLEEYYYFIPLPTTRMSAGNVVVYAVNISVDGISVEFKEENKIEDWIESGVIKPGDIF